MQPKTITIGDRLIGEGHPCFIIAEAGVNHNGSLEMALELVDVAAEAGADAVKFQKRVLENLYPPALLNNPNSAEWAFQYMLPVLKKTELSHDDFRKIKTHCEQRDIRFMCTPWDEDSLKFLDELGQDAVKVASADLVNFPLLAKMVATGKPIIVSTGMATPIEIDRTVCFLRERQAQFALLHCVSTYPAPFESLNLRFIETLKQYGVPIGYSSHERGIVIPIVALAFGASIIEKHITLDRTLPGPDHPASLEPQGMGKLVRDIRNAEIALGCNHKRLSSMEKLNRQVLRKSLVAAHFLPSGTLVTEEMIKTKGPGKGLTPQRVNELLGATLDRDVEEDDYFTEGDLRPHFDKVMMVNQFRHPWGLKARFHDLADAIDQKPRLIELHFSEADVDHPFQPPEEPYSQQLFIHAPEFFDQKLLDLATFDEERREQSIDLLQRTIDKTVQLKPHFTSVGGIVIHVGGMSMDKPVANHQKLLQRAADAFKRLDGHGLVLLPENLPPRPWYLGGQWFQNIFIRPEEMIEFCQELNVGMTLDLSHAQLYCTAYDRSLREYIDLCLPYTTHLHIADASGIDGEGIQIGEGVIEWEPILERLAHAEFTWVPEIWSGHLHNGAGFIEAVNRLNHYSLL